jgi:hypothetical protein
MAYVFIWDSMRTEMSNNLFLKTLGASLIGEGFTLSNFIMISDNNECVLLDLPFGNAVKGDVYLLNNKGITLLEKFYDTSKYYKKKISCYYNSCGCNKDKYEKIDCFIYCINKPELIENYIKNINKKSGLIESGDWKSYLKSESLNS